MNNNYYKNAYYLMIKNGFYNEGLDEALLNLLLIVIKGKHYDIITDINELVEEFKERIGFELPYFPMNTTLLAAKKKGYIVDANKRGEYVPNYSMINNITSMKEITARENALQELKNSFYNFLITKDKDSNYTEEKAGELIDNFVETQGALFYHDKGEFLLNSHENYLFATFINDDHNKKYYDLIDELVAGRILSELLLHEDNKIDLKKSSFKNVTVYLDAGLIFILLDIDELHRFQSYEQLIKDMQSLGITIKIFRHTFIEVESIISNSIQWINNPDFDPALSSKAAYYFVTNSFMVEDIEEILATMSLKLERMGITIDDMDYPTNIPAGKLCQEDFYQEIKSYYNERNIYFDEEEMRNTIDNDAKSFFFISVKNNYLPSYQLSDLRNVLLTNNTSLAIVSKNIFNIPRNIPFCITDTFFGALIWKSNPQKINLPSKQKLSNFIYQAFSPTDAMLNKFSKVIKESFENQKITSEECIVLRQNKVAAKLLVEVTTGDIEQISIDTPYDIIKRIRETAVEFGRKEVLEKSNKIIEEKNQIINNQKEELRDSKIQIYSTQIKECKSRKTYLEEKIEEINLERDNGKNYIKKKMRNYGLAGILFVVLLICISLWFFDFGNKKGIDYIGLIGFLLSVFVLIIPTIIAMFKNNSFNLVEIVKEYRKQILEDYYHNHNCTDVLLDETKNKLKLVSEECENLEKGLDSFYFSD